MSDAAAINPEFGFVETLPQGVATEAKRGIEAFKVVVRDYEEAQAKHGLLVPITTVAEALGVSPQRVTMLIDDGRIAAVTVTGRRWAVAQSVVDYLKAGPRPTGRPKKLSKWGNSVRVGKELAAAAEAVMERP